MFKRSVVALLFISIVLSATAGMAHAEDLPIAAILENGFYGGVIGSLLGTASIAFTDEPSDHLNFIAKGAAYGVFAGTIFGMYQLKDYFVSIEGGKLDLAVPVIKYEQYDRLYGENKTRYHANLLAYRF